MCISMLYLSSAEIAGSSAEWKHCGCSFLHVHKHMDVDIKDLLVLDPSHHVYADYTVVFL